METEETETPGPKFVSFSHGRKSAPLKSLTKYNNQVTFFSPFPAKGLSLSSCKGSNTLAGRHQSFFLLSPHPKEEGESARFEKRKPLARPTERERERERPGSYCRRQGLAHFAGSLTSLLLSEAISVLLLLFLSFPTSVSRSWNVR